MDSANVKILATRRPVAFMRPSIAQSNRTDFAYRKQHNFGGLSPKKLGKSGTFDFLGRPWS